MRPKKKERDGPVSRIRQPPITEQKRVTGMILDGARVFSASRGIVDRSKDEYASAFVDLMRRTVVVDDDHKYTVYAL